MKSGILLYLYMVCAGLLSAFCGATAGEQYNYRQITPRDGMLSNVRCVHAEKRGFVWIGSSTEGLMRFDNYLPRRYSSHDKGGHALPGNNITQIAEDSLGQIWVLTNKGLARYRPETDDFFIPKQVPDPGGGEISSSTVPARLRAACSSDRRTRSSAMTMPTTRSACC